MRWVRGRVAVAVAVGVLALLAGCSGDSDRSRGSDGKGDTGARVPTSVGAMSPRIPSATDLPGFVAGVGFASDGSGFALLAECGEARCRQRVAVLDAGAGSWRLGRSPLPDVTGDLGITAGLVVLGPGRALITEGRWPPPDGTWFTGDGGRSWRRGSTKPSGTTPVVPKGGALVEDCVRMDREGNGCERSRLAAVLPTTGEYRLLSVQPPLKVIRPAGEVAGDTEQGLLFASGRDPRSGRLALAVSEDRGRTWRPTRLTASGTYGEPYGWSTHVVAAAPAEPELRLQPQTLYAAQPGQLPDEDDVKNGLLALHRSTDAGHTWERVWQHRTGVEPRSLLGAPVAAADGSLTVHGEAGVWRSTDGGRSFARVSAGRGMSGSVTTTPLGYLWGDSLGAGSWRISADGVHWRSFELGDRN
ncbi:exo-alpha-sialidase [Streptomyces sp. NPDC002838]|uniref:exo-alpha-sialidase n=1 Tax=Streptomyces sp. NPDC002838 TaxID=3154436 RepID=UPI00331ED4DF